MKIGNISLPGSAWVAILTALAAFLTANFDQSALYIEVALVVIYALINWINTEKTPVEPSAAPRARSASVAEGALAEAETPTKSRANVWLFGR